jgi:hypothetical protein
MVENPQEGEATIPVKKWGEDGERIQVIKKGLQ